MAPCGLSSPFRNEFVPGTHAGEISVPIRHSRGVRMPPSLARESVSVADIETEEARSAAAQSALIFIFNMYLIVDRLARDVCSRGMEFALRYGIYECGVKRHFYIRIGDAACYPRSRVRRNF